VARSIIIDGWYDMFGIRNGSKSTSQGGDTVV